MTPAAKLATTSRERESRPHESAQPTSSEQLGEPGAETLSHLLAGGPTEPPVDGIARFLAHPSVAVSANGGTRSVAVKRAQQTYGNRTAQRVVSNVQRKPTSLELVQRQCAGSGARPTCRTDGLLDYSAGSDSGRNLLAHEVAHVVQQSAGIWRTTAAAEHAYAVFVVAPDDLLKVEAAGAAEVFVQGADSGESATDRKRLLGTPTSDPMSRRQAPPTQPAKTIVAREPAPDIDGATYLERFSDAIGNGVADFLKGQTVTTGSSFLTWTGDAAFPERLLSSLGGTGELVKRLPEFVRPTDLLALANRDARRV